MLSLLFVGSGSNYFESQRGDLLTVDALEAVGYNLARLGHDVLQASAQLAGVDDELAIIGMGKLGGAELNYASDIDIMFVGDGDDIGARKVMEIARQCFRVDAALRPEGRDGVLVRSLDSYRRYWAEYAQTWEFQALLKARPLVGPEELKRRVEPGRKRRAVESAIRG